MPCQEHTLCMLRRRVTVLKVTMKRGVGSSPEFHPTLLEVVPYISRITYKKR